MWKVVGIGLRAVGGAGCTKAEQQARLHNSKGMPGCMHGYGLSLGVQWDLGALFQCRSLGGLCVSSPHETCLISVHMT